MSAIKVYAIRQVGTSNYLPSRVGGKARNFSDARLELDGGRWGPRLFGTKRGAINAKSAWLAGLWSVQWRHNSWGDEYGNLEPTTDPARLAIELEIVEFELTERRPA